MKKHYTYHKSALILFPVKAKVFKLFLILLFTPLMNPVHSQATQDDIVYTYLLGTDFLEDAIYDSAMVYLIKANTLYKELEEDSPFPWQAQYFMNYKVAEAAFGLHNYEISEEYALRAIHIADLNFTEEDNENLKCQALNFLTLTYDRMSSAAWVDYYAPMLKTCHDPFYQLNSQMTLFVKALAKGELHNAAMINQEIWNILTHSGHDPIELSSDHLANYYINSLALAKEVNNQELLSESFYRLDSFYYHNENALHLKTKVHLLSDLISTAIELELDYARYINTNNKLLNEHDDSISYESHYLLINHLKGKIDQGEFNEVEQFLLQLLDKNKDGYIDLDDWNNTGYKELYIELYELFFDLQLEKVRREDFSTPMDTIIPLINNYFRFSDLKISSSQQTLSRLAYLNYSEETYSVIKELFLHYYDYDKASISAETLWAFHDKMKGNLYAVLLRENLAINTTLSTDTLKLELQRLRDSLNSYQNKIASTKDKGKLSGIKYSFYMTQKAIDSLMGKIPDAYKNTNINSVDIKDYLAYNRTNKTTSIQYSISDNYLHIFIFTQDKLYYFAEKMKKNELIAMFTTYRKQLSFYDYLSLSHTAYQNRITDFHMLSHELYQLFLEPYERYLTFKLRIIPDPLMMGIPFETLCMNKMQEGDSFSELNYAIYNHAFHYHMINYKTDGRDTEPAQPYIKELLSIVPDYEQNPTHNTLGARLSEHKYFMELPNTTIWTGAKANPDYILNNWSKYSIINFTGHASADDTELTSSYLLTNYDHLNNSRIFTEDIQYESLQASLVFLNACSTQGHQRHFTEGLLGLQRAFFLAHVRSVIATAWPVSDREASFLLRNTYDNIKRGAPVDEALRNAKLELILDKDPIKSLPFYWAAQTLNGEIVNASELIKIEKPYRWTSYLVPVLLALLLFWFFKRQRRKA